MHFTDFENLSECISLWTSGTEEAGLRMEGMGWFCFPQQETLAIFMNG